MCKLHDWPHFQTCSSCFGRTVKHACFVSIKPLPSCFLREQDLYYYVVSYICTKNRIFTLFRITKWGIDTVSANCLKLENILARNFFLSSWQLKVRVLNIPKFTLQDSIWLILISGSIVKQKGWTSLWCSANWKYLWTSMLIFFSRKIFVFFAEEPDPRYIYNFAKSFEG